MTTPSGKRMPINEQSSCVRSHRLPIVGKRIKLKGENRTMQPCGPAAGLVCGNIEYGESRNSHAEQLRIAGQQALWMYVICSRVDWLANEAAAR